MIMAMIEMIAAPDTEMPAISGNDRTAARERKNNSNEQLNTPTTTTPSLR